MPSLLVPGRVWSMVAMAVAVSCHLAAASGPDFDGDGFDDLVVGVPMENVDGKADAGAVHVIYGSSVMMVYTTGQGVHGFTLDPSVGEFMLSHENIQIPSKGKIYSVNEGNEATWDDRTRAYIRHVKQSDPDTGRPYSGRYIGSLVADFHRNLLYGGIFLYPPDMRDPKKPKPKLRLLYEAAPLAFIVEQAGGKATTGGENILDLQPASLHQKVPLIIGGREDVEQYERFWRGEAS